MSPPGELVGVGEILDDEAGEDGGERPAGAVVNGCDERDE